MQQLLLASIPLFRRITMANTTIIGAMIVMIIIIINLNIATFFVATMLLVRLLVFQMLLTRAVHAFANFCLIAGPIVHINNVGFLKLPTQAIAIAGSV